jgi:hypothetical protein
MRPWLEEWSYEAEVPRDANGQDLCEWLVAQGALEPPHGFAYRLVLWRAGTEVGREPALPELAPQDLGSEQTLAELAAADGDCVVIYQDHHGAGPVEVVAALGGAKLAIDAARVGVDAYRARTERLAAELERERFEAENRTDGSPGEPPR